tara:strand:- start:1233 stop:2015 length:783 start_codon:yes stop_codon:yes gene_type:complete
MNKSTYRNEIKINNNQLFQIIKDRINKKASLSIVRKGDGENVIIGYKVVNGIKMIKYLRKLRHFNISITNFKFQNFLKDELVKSFLNADFLGVAKDYSYSSIRKFDSIISKYYQFNSNTYIDSHFHLEFAKKPNSMNLLNNHAQDIISNKKIGIVTHFNINSFLEHHNSKVVIRYKIPKREAGFFKKMNFSIYNNILSGIKSNNSKVDIWLLSAGPYAKLFCNYIKNIGGIGLDVGSAVDTWAGEYHSRKYLKELLKKDD